MPATPAALRIGCIHYQVSFPYWASVAQGINARAAERGARLILPTIDPEEDLPGALSEVVGQRPAAVILTNIVLGYYPEAPRRLREAGIPIVGVEVGPDANFAAVVRADERQGADLAAERLFALLGGHGKVAHIRGVTNAPHRGSAFAAALARHPGVALAYEGDGMWTQEDGAQIMRAALAADPAIRGVFAHNDLMAVGALDAIAELGHAGEITVVGFDADPEGLIAIREGRLAATVYRALYGIGRAAVDAALSVAEGATPEADIVVPVKLITPDNLVEATLDTVYLLPGLLRELVQANHTQRQTQQETIAAQRLLIRELSTPIIPISDDILIMPLIGAIDSRRAMQVMESILQAIVEHGAQFMIIDITGIAVVDTAVAHHLIQTARAIQLLGAQIILVGISPEVAQTMVGLGIDFSSLITHATLQTGLAFAQNFLARRAARAAAKH
jgi:anti-anti-sigma factor